MIYFIKPSDVIKRIRDTIATAEANLDLPEGFVAYSNRVGGSAMIAELDESNVQNLLRPSCYVVLSNGSGITSGDVMNLHQNIVCGFDIVLLLDTKDTRKQSAEERAASFMDLFIYCLNGWKPIDSKYDACSPLRFVSDSVAYSGRDSYLRIYSFAYDVQFAASDDLLDDPTDFDIQNFEKFFADLVMSDTVDEIEVQKTDLYDTV